MSRVANASVGLLLRSPAHRLLSERIQLIRYQGRRSGIERTTPTQYVELADRVAVLVGRPDTKRWWRNFTDPWPVDLLVRGEWRHLQGRACWRHEDPDAVDAALRAFTEKYGATPQQAPDDDVLVVLCEGLPPADPATHGRAAAPARVEDLGPWPAPHPRPDAGTTSSGTAPHLRSVARDPGDTDRRPRRTPEGGRVMKVLIVDDGAGCAVEPAAKIERVTRRDGTLHIQMSTEEPVPAAATHAAAVRALVAVRDLEPDARSISVTVAHESRTSSP